MTENLTKKLKWFLNSFIWLGILLLVLDIISKNIVVQYQAEINSGGGNNGGIDIIPGFLGINYTINNHIVFGLDIFKNDIATRIVFVIVALSVSAGIIIYLYKKWDKINRFYKACFMMIIAGAVGNSIDRIFYSPSYLNYGGLSGVVDWIDFYGIWKFNFNIADCAVVIAAIMLVIYMIVTEIIDYRKKSKLVPKEEKSEKVLSKTEQQQNQYLEKKKHKDE